MPESKIIPVFNIRFKVIAYDCSGYGEDCTREFKSGDEAINYARTLEKRFDPQVVKIIDMNPIYVTIPHEQKETHNGIS